MAPPCSRGQASRRPVLTDLKAPRLAIALKGYPRLSETFIAQEFLGLQQRGIDYQLWSLRRPYDDRTHPIHSQITAPVHYLQEYLHEEPARVWRSWRIARRLPGYRAALAAWRRDLWRDPSRNRVRRFGQACVMAAELEPSIAFLYVHFLHTPASVVRYAAKMRGVGWGFSAHARDIWTIPEHEKREKIADARFGVTCTASGAEHLRSLAPDPSKISLVYHGLDLSRFPAPPERRREGGPFRLVSVGRLVAKKGYDDLLAALALLPSGLEWHLTQIGGGELKAPLRAEADRLGLSARIDWQGKRDQTDVIAALRAADLFVLPSKTAADGDRDGLPNVLMEAASQKLPVLSTATSAIPEFVEDGVTGTLVPPADPAALAAALERLACDPEGCARMAGAAYDRLRTHFGAEAGVDRVAALLREALA